MNRQLDPSTLLKIADRFELGGAAQHIVPLTGGNINDTYLVTTAPPAGRQIVLQRINRRVFPRPEAVIDNTALVTRHLAYRPEQSTRQRYRSPRQDGVARQPDQPGHGPHCLAHQTGQTADGTGHKASRRHQRSDGTGHKASRRHQRSDGTGHKAPRQDRLVASEGFDWQVPTLIGSRDGGWWHRDVDGEYWRAGRYIPDSIVFDRITQSHQARGLGLALGWFHRMTADMETRGLHEILIGFHDTPRYLARYEQLGAVRTEAGDHERLAYCRRFVTTHRDWAFRLVKPAAGDRFARRIIHGDPKITNVLFHRLTGRPLGLIDFDTVKAGSILYDIGDCLRSGCNPAGEETRQPQTAAFDLDRCRSILSGYAESVEADLDPNAVTHFFDAVLTITFELGIRFLTDYLEGNPYFKTDRPDHNLDRAAVQFHLADSIHRRQTEIQSVIDTVFPGFAFKSGDSIPIF